MSSRAPVSRRERVAAALTQQITSGRLRPGEQLDGEVRLAEQFEVSRGTIRQALGDLQERKLITTHAGVGSFVSYDGVALDQNLGWARALAEGGAPVTTELLGIEPIPRAAIPDFPPDVELAGGIAVRRLRRGQDGSAVSLECATVPAAGSLLDLPASGLVEGSLTKTLGAAGLVAHHGAQHVSVVPLGDPEAASLGVARGRLFLKSVRTSFAEDGRLVEHVVSHLDPEHFSLHINFGEQ